MISLSTLDRLSISAHTTIGGLAMPDIVMTDTFWIGVWPGLTIPMLDYMIEKNLSRDVQ